MTPVAQPTPAHVCLGDPTHVTFADLVKPINCGSKERAAFIVLACNSFDALTEANKKLVAALEYIRDLGADGADKKYMRAQSKAERVLDEVRK